MHGTDLPYNTIELLILGNLTNNGSSPISLKNAWLVVPYSMGIQTEYEGVWQRIEDPNSYFTVYCWCAAGLWGCMSLSVCTLVAWRTPCQQGVRGVKV